jgi:hypothetical protein
VRLSQYIRGEQIQATAVRLTSSMLVVKP